MNDAGARIAFRCDAGPRTGGGHVGRCLTLAEALRAAGARVQFAVRPGTLERTPPLSASGFAVTVLSEDAGHEVSEIAARIGQVDLLVLDHYGLGASFAREAHLFARAILVIDDVPDRLHHCDILLDTVGGHSEADWRAVAGASTEILTGPAYALIRNDIVALRGTAMARAEPVRRMLVSFGLSDSKNATAFALSALHRDLRLKRIDVTLSSASPHRDAVLAAAVGKPVELHIDPPDYPALLIASDLAIGAGGVSALERACLGLPSVVIQTAANQAPGARALAGCGALENLGPVAEVTPERLTAAVAALASDAPRRAEMSQRAAATVDGRGAARIAQYVTALLARAG